MSRGALTGRVGAILLPGLAALLVSACSAGAGHPQAGHFEIEKHYGDAAATGVAVRVSRASISTAEDLSLVVEARAAAGWYPVLPELPDSLGQFRVTARGTESRRIGRDGYLVASRAYTLEPFLPGSYEIPPLTASFLPDGGGTAVAVNSEKIPVRVTSVLPAMLIGEQDIDEVTPPAEMPARGLAWALVAAVSCVAAGGLLFRATRGNARVFPARPRPATPWQAALDRLDAILAEQNAGRARGEECLTVLSALTRSYVEDRYRIRAPQRTTEEFLQEVRANPALRDSRQLLRDFLAQCDLVKFARYRPSGQEVSHAVEACRKFITATIPGGSAA